MVYSLPGVHAATRTVQSLALLPSNSPLERLLLLWRVDRKKLGSISNPPILGALRGWRP